MLVMVSARKKEGERSATRISVVIFSKTCGAVSLALVSGGPLLGRGWSWSAFAGHDRPSGTGCRVMALGHAWAGSWHSPEQLEQIADSPPASVFPDHPHRFRFGPVRPEQTSS